MYGYIYMILNKVNNKTYIGQRKSNKFCYDDNYMGSGKLLLKAYKKYGIENFEKLLVQYVETKEEANNQEKFWIAHYRERGMAQYNLADGGDGGRVPGHTVSEETRRKVSETMKGKPKSEEHKKKISEAHRGMEYSAKTKKKLSEIRKKYWSMKNKITNIL